MIPIIVTSKKINSISTFLSNISIVLLIKHEEGFPRVRAYVHFPDAFVGFSDHSFVLIWVLNMIFVLWHRLQKHYDFWQLKDCLLLLTLLKINFALRDRSRSARNFLSLFGPEYLLVYKYSLNLFLVREDILEDMVRLPALLRDLLVLVRQQESAFWYLQDC